MTRQIGLKGGPELMAFLDAFPARLQKNALKSAMIAGARVVRDEARANVPRKSGKLAKAIKTSSPRAFTGGAASVKVKVLGQHSFIGHFIEYGVSPHLITAGDSDLTVRTLNKRAKKGDGIQRLDNGLIRVGGYEGTRLVKTKDGDREDTFKINAAFVRGAVMHPGFPAKPFLRPALDHKASEVIDAIGARLREYLKSKTNFTAPVTIEADVEE
jgi:HK97 gp10 family phage protein